MDANIKPGRKGRFSEIPSWQEQYKLKTVMAEEAVVQVRKGDFIFTNGAVNYPEAFDKALVKYVSENGYHADIYTAYLLKDHEILRSDYKDNFEIYVSFLGTERKILTQGNLQFIPCHLGDVSKIIRSFRPRVGAFAVSPPDENGWMSRSLWTHHYSKEAYQNDDCEVLVVEVNEKLPFIFSEGPDHTYIHVSEVDYIIENNYSLLEIKAGVATAEESRIADYIADLIEDGDCIQIGLGGLADAIGSNLVKAGKKDLGLYSEILTNGLIDLIQAGVMNNSRKNFHPGKSVVSCCIGDKRQWDYCHRNEAMLLLEVGYLNDIRNICKNDNMVSINNCLEIDLTGQVNSEAIGTRQYSSTGGQLQFVIGSQLSKNGKSFLALNSFYTDKKGNMVSKITPILDPGTPITTPRTYVNYVVTEFGVADLRYKSTRARAQALINIAHPQFRDELTAEAKKYGW